MQSSFFWNIDTLQIIQSINICQTETHVKSSEVYTIQLDKKAENQILWIHKNEFQFVRRKHL